MFSNCPKKIFFLTYITLSSANAFNFDQFKKLLNLYHIIPTFNNPKEKALENAGNQHFLLFPQCFLLYHREKFLEILIVATFILSSANFCRFMKG